MKTPVKSMRTAMLYGALAACAGAVLGPKQATAYAEQACEQQPRYRGCASCQIECPDGKCKVIRSIGSGYSSYDAAKLGLQVNLLVLARREGGDIKGGIVFMIFKE